MPKDLSTLFDIVFWGGASAAASGASSAAAAAGLSSLAENAGNAADDYWGNRTTAVNAWFDGDPPTDVADANANVGDFLPSVTAGNVNVGTNGVPSTATAESASEISESVWSYPLEPGLGLTKDVMARQSYKQYVEGLFHVGRDFRAPRFIFWMNSFLVTAFEEFNPVPPSATFDDVLMNETLVEYLNRVDGSFEWSDAYFPGYVASVPGGGGSSVGWICDLNQYEFDFLKHYRWLPSSGPPLRSTLGDMMLLVSLAPIQYPP